MGWDKATVFGKEQFEKLVVTWYLLYLGTFIFSCKCLYPLRANTDLVLFFKKDDGNVFAYLSTQMSDQRTVKLFFLHFCA